MPPEATAAASRVVGRYVLYDEIGSGGMASVHLGRLLGPAGFSRTVAIKRLQPPYAKDPEFVSMFLDEARLAARIRHPNVAATIDVVALEGELFLIMEFVQGETLSRLLRAVRAQGGRVPVPVALSIAVDTLYGLHAAHEAKSEDGEPLALVHRDVSPHNIIVGHDGVARALDFGVAKATARIQTTREGHLKGKLAYMSPEQLSRKGVDRRADVFAASIVLWETLTCERLFGGDDVGDLVARILTEPIEPPSKLRPEVKVGLDAIVLRGLLRDPNDRYGSAREMAAALEAELAPARAAQVGEWVDSIAGDVLRRRAQRVAEIERSSSRLGTARDEERGVQVPRAGDPAYATAPTLMVIDSSSQAGLGSGAEGVASRVTELSSASPPPATRVRTRTQRVGVAALLMVALAVASFGALVRRRHTRAPAAAVAASKSPPREEIGAMSVESPFSAAASASSSAGAAKPSSSTAPAVPTVRGHPRQDCSPPYYFDAAGLKHFKPGCV